MFKYFIDGIKNYINFNGVSNRQQFWYYQLSCIVIGVVLGVIASVIGTDGKTISDVYTLFLFLPSLAIGTRRLRDAGLSPWWMFFVLVPIVGAIALVVLWCKPSNNTR